jgi:hypothetical protein
MQQLRYQYTTSIEEQYYVIEGLKRKRQDEREVDDMMLRKYQNKYEQLYFSRKNDLSNWKNYKSYLQELIKKDQVDLISSEEAYTLLNNNGMISLLPLYARRAI